MGRIRTFLLGAALTALAIGAGAEGPAPMGIDFANPDGKGSEVRAIQAPATLVPAPAPETMRTEATLDFWGDLLILFIVAYSLLLFMPGGSLATWMRMAMASGGNPGAMRPVPVRWEGPDRRRGMDRRRMWNEAMEWHTADRRHTDRRAYMRIA